MTANLPVMDPTRIQCPVMIARGEFDGIATEENLWDFFRQLPNGDRQYVILPGLAHSLSLGLKRQMFFHAAQAFLAAPVG
jgi:pimeloyl-ACP methyl ester carboxylesterase